VNIPHTQPNSLLARRADNIDETKEEEESENEDFRTAPMIRRRTLQPAFRYAYDDLFDDTEETSDDDANDDDDASTVCAEGTNGRDEMQEEEDVNDDDEFPYGDANLIAGGTNEVEEMQE
jgi:hypothetical protein